MIKRDIWVRVPVSALQKVSDHLCNIDCIQANLIKGSIKNEVHLAHEAMANALGDKSSLIYAEESEGVTHA